MGKKGTRRQWAVGGAGSPACTTKFTAPTSGLEDAFFTWGTAKDAAKFEDMVSKLARHVGTSPWPQPSVASKAMSTLKSPEFEEPAFPFKIPPTQFESISCCDDGKCWGGGRGGNTAGGGRKSREEGSIEEQINSVQSDVKRSAGRPKGKTKKRCIRKTCQMCID